MTETKGTFKVREYFSAGLGSVSQRADTNWRVSMLNISTIGEGTLFLL